MASIEWDAEPGSQHPRATIHLDGVVRNCINVTGIVGLPDYQGTFVRIVFMSEANARIAMGEILQQLKNAGGIHGYLHDSRTGASLY